MFSLRKEGQYGMGKAKIYSGDGLELKLSVRIHYFKSCIYIHVYITTIYNIDTHTCL